jgi:hemerythrin
MSIELDQLPEQYRLGHESIDGQHEILFQLYRELSEFCSDEKYDLELDLILLSLKTYVVTHFRFEEELMAASGYEHMVEHQIEHNNLEQQVIDQIERFGTLTGNDEKRGFALGMKGFLFSWLADHIAKTDRKFCQTLH